MKTLAKSWKISKSYDITYQFMWVLRRLGAIDKDTFYEMWNTIYDVNEAIKVKELSEMKRKISENIS